METGHIVVAGLWGFLVGFVGWGSMSRLPASIAGWLVQVTDEQTPALLTARVLVTIFWFLAIMIALALVPALEIAAAHHEGRSVPTWRDVFGIAFVASWAGFAATGFLQRWANASNARRRAKH